MGYSCFARFGFVCVSVWVGINILLLEWIIFSDPMSGMWYSIPDVRDYLYKHQVYAALPKSIGLNTNSGALYSVSCCSTHEST